MLMADESDASSCGESKITRLTMSIMREIEVGIAEVGGHGSRSQQAAQ